MVYDNPPGEPASCNRNYRIYIDSDGGGWGDPHINTVDGVRYDFQSAGEFIALRGKDFELQTRQTPIATSHVPGKNAYTGIASCVSIYTAVAMRVGNYKITVQPNINGKPDPDGLHIPVYGELRSLGPNGINLSACNCPADEIRSSGRVVRSADEQSIEKHSSDSTKIVVTPAWWSSQQKWYLHVNVFDTTASQGIMGRVVDRWLPGLSNGDAIGSKSSNIEERYKQLYEKFADSWRVSDESSLFDYAANTSTDNFTVKEWPRYNPSSCILEAEPLAVAIEESVARAACSNVVNEDIRMNCEFDVMETGHLGFADAYERAEQITPGATRTFLVQDDEDK